MSCNLSGVSGTACVSSPAMQGPYTFSNYGTCNTAAGCGGVSSGPMTAAQRSAELATMASNGTLSYGDMGRDACGLAAGLPSGAAWAGEKAAMATLQQYAAHPAAAAAEPELGNQRIATAPVTDGMNSSGVLYDWRRNAWRYQPGMVYREWTDRQRAAAGIDDPWGNQTARQFQVNVGEGWAGVVNLSGTKAAGAINYAGQPLAGQGECNPRTNQSMFQQECLPSPQAYGQYKQYGIEPDFFRSTPYSVAYSSPSANPQAFTVATTLPQAATPQKCVSQQ